MEHAIIINEVQKKKQLEQFQMSYSRYLSVGVLMDEIARVAYETKRTTLIALGVASEAELNNIEAAVVSEKINVIRTSQNRTNRVEREALVH